MADTENKQEKQEIVKKDVKSVTKQKRRALARLRLTAVAVVLLLVLIGILKLVSYIGGISRTQLTDEGLTHAKRFVGSGV